MPRYLLDTDHLTLYTHAHPTVIRYVKLHRAALATSVVAAEEVLRGRLAQVASAADGPSRILCYELLTQAIQLFTQFPIVPYDQSAEGEFQRLRSIRIGSRDLKIASIALANGVIVVTRNRRHFGLVPGLTIEDWSV